jgi:glutamine amidotransferase
MPAVTIRQRSVAVVDVCSGNLRSVARALAKVGGDVVVTRDPDVVRRADRIVVPGQGEFGAFARGLVNGLGEALREVLASGRPYLGICLGLQVLFDESEEAPGVAGLGIIPGRVVRFKDPTVKVPHIGWNQIWRDQRVDRSGEPMLQGIDDGAHVYFVHSYYPAPVEDGVIALTSDHAGRFCAAIRKDNLFAVQFHPEKSQAIGLAMLANFV